MSKASNLAGFVTSITPINNLNVGVITATNFNASAVNVVGVITATSFVGDGSGLTGVGPSQQAVTSQSPTTTINLSLGNVIYFTHNTDTTVAFANTSTTQEITLIRAKDNTGTARAITWPSSIKWPGLGSPPIFTKSTRNQ